MSHIEMLMQELDLSQDTINATLNKINEICPETEHQPKQFYIRINGNGDGDGDGDN